jgi:hypothetical protein
VAVAVATYNASEEDADAALARLDSVLAQQHDHAIALFDRAAILNEQGRSADAAAAWRRFLDVEPSGPWAETARAWLGIPEPAARVGSAPSGLWGNDVPLGSEPLPAALLAASSKVDFQIGTLLVEVIRGPRVKILRLGGSTVLVETAIGPLSSEQKKALGDPIDVQPLAEGTLTTYPGYALQEGTRTVFIRFAPPPGER